MLIVVLSYLLRKRQALTVCLAASLLMYVLPLSQEPNQTCHAPFS